MTDNNRPPNEQSNVGSFVVSSNNAAAANFASSSSPSNNGNGNVFVRNNADTQYDVQKYLDEFWPYQTERIEKMSPMEFRDPKINQELPLARIKKIMKLDEDVKTQMISAEAPVLFAKACEMFIEELTIRAWIHTEDNKRKTLQKNDIAMAISKHDQFDFLIDIVPREEITKSGGGGREVGGSSVDQKPPMDHHIHHNSSNAQVESQMPMFVQMPNASGIVAQPGMQTIQLQNGQFVQAQTLGGAQAMQLVQGANGELQLVSLGGAPQQMTAQVLHTAPVQIAQHHQQQQQSHESASHQAAASAQAFQQIVAPDGSVHHLPIQLSPAQMNCLKQYLNTGGGGNGQQQSQQQQQQPQQIHIMQQQGGQFQAMTSTGQPITIRTQGGQQQQAQQQQQQQQQAFFVQTSGPIGQQSTSGGVQLQMVASGELQGSDIATTSSS